MPNPRAHIPHLILAEMENIGYAKCISAELENETQSIDQPRDRMGRNNG